MNAKLFLKTKIIDNRDNLSTLFSSKSQAHATSFFVIESLLFSWCFNSLFGNMAITTPIFIFKRHKFTAFSSSEFHANRCAIITCYSYFYSNPWMFRRVARFWDTISFFPFSLNIRIRIYRVSFVIFFRFSEIQPIYGP